jgi:hypothetical protein
MAIQGLINVKKALNTLNPNQIRELSENPLHVSLHAASEAGYSRMEDYFLSGLSPSRRRQSALLLSRGANTLLGRGPDLRVYEDGMAVPSGSLLFQPQRPELLIEKALTKYPDLGVSLAKSFAPFRKPYIQRVINKTARENTLFSIATALPDVIPSVIELPWAVAEFASDTAFLTVNQVRMAFLIAAASDREVGYSEQKSEIATVIGSAFGWRALARQVVSKVPFGGGLVGKAAVAYAGTKVLGLSLEHLYSIGFNYTREERNHLYADALAQGRKVASKILTYMRPDLAARYANENTSRANS